MVIGGDIMDRTPSIHLASAPVDSALSETRQTPIKNTNSLTVLSKDVERDACAKRG